MANTRDQMFLDIQNGTAWEAGVVFKRLNGIPFDPKSVFKTKAELDNYAKNDGTAYPSQVCAVVNEDGSVNLYYIDGNGNTVAIGGDVAADLGALTTRVTTAEGEIKVLIADLDALEAKVATAEGKITTLEGKVATAEGEIDTLQSDLDAAEGKITTLEGKMTTAEGEIDTLQSDVSTLKTAVNTTLPGLIDAVEEDVADHETRLSAVEGKMTTAEGEIDTLQSDLDAVEEDVADHETRLGAAEGKIVVLVGDDANKSVRTIAAEEIAAQLIPGDAAEALNSLEEIAAWIQDHPEDASAMNEAIVALQNQLKGIDAGEGTVKKYVDDAITALKIGDYAKAADLTALAARVTTLEGEMDAVEGRATALEGRATTDEGKITTLEGKMTTAEGKIATLESDSATAKSDISGIKTDLDVVEEDVADHETRLATVEGKVADLEENDATQDENISNIGAKIDAYATKVDGLIAGGGEPNVLETVKVDGAALIVTDKSVNIDLANATVAKAGVATTANATKGTLSAGGKTFNGSADVTITADDLGALTSVPTATNEALGLVKGNNAQDGVAVNGAGELTVNNISASKVQGSVASAAKVDNKITIGGKEFDGSSAVSVTTDDLGVYTKSAADEKYVAKTQKGSANTAGIVQVDGTTITAVDGVISAKQAGAASENNAGLMSAEHFEKLEGIEAGANKTVVDASLSSTSTNPIQNKAVKSALDGKVDKVDGKGLSTNDFTTAEKEKLAGIAAGANAYELPEATATTLGGVKIGKNINVAADGTISVDDAVTYDEATQTAAGLMSAADKKKVDAIANDIATAKNAVQENVDAVNDRVDDLTTEVGKKAAQTDLDVVSAKVTTLVGSDANKSVRAISAEEVAKVVANAPEDFNTLKELADWITTHGGDAAAMNSAITALENKLAGIDSTVVAYVTAAIDALKIGEYAKAADLTALAGRVADLEAKPDYVLPAATATKLGGIKVGANLTVAADGTLSAVDTTYTVATTSADGLMSKSDKAKVDAIATDISSAVSAAKTELNTAIGKKADSSTVTTLTGRVTAVEGEVDALNAVATGFSGEGAIKNYVDTKVADAALAWGTI